MADPSTPLPAAAPGDPEDTLAALETARALWAAGERRDALRWVRRASEGAAAAGKDLRAVQIARAAAELRSQLEIPATRPPDALVPGGGLPVIPKARAPQIEQAQQPVPAQQATVVVTLDGHASTAGDVSKLVAKGATRVCLWPGPEGSGSWLVRELAPGEIAPAEARVALLVSLD